MTAAILLVLAILMSVAVFQPGGPDFLRVSVATVNAHTVTVLEVLSVMTVLVVMVAFRGAIAIAGAALLVLWSVWAFNVIRIDSMAAVAMAAFVILLGGIAHIVSAWAKH